MRGSDPTRMLGLVLLFCVAVFVGIVIAAVAVSA